MTHVQPLHQFRVTVALRLQKPPFNWVGGAGFQLADKYAALIEKCWNEYEFAEATAGLVNQTYMQDSKPFVKSVFPTRESMQAVGCKYYEV